MYTKGPSGSWFLMQVSELYDSEAIGKLWRVCPIEHTQIWICVQYHALKKNHMNLLL